MKKDRIGERAGKLIKLADKYKFVLIVILAGLILLALPRGGGDETERETQGGMQEELFDTDTFEEKLKTVLQKMDGVGRAEVVLTLESGSRRVLAENKNLSYDGQEDYSADTSTVVVSTGSGTEEAIVVERVYPAFRGALIVCEGGGSAQVRLAVTEAVAALTGMGSDNIRVTKMS